MKFKTVQNKTFALQINHNESIQIVIKKISEIISVYHEDIILICKNVRLDADKYIDDYNIGLNDHVLVIVNSDKQSKNPDENKYQALGDNNLLNYSCSFEYDGFCRSPVKLKKREIEEPLIILKCVNVDYKIIELHLKFGKSIDDIVDSLSGQIDIPKSNIKLFKDKNLQSPINNNDFIQFLKSRQQINVYYEIVADVEKLVKQRVLGRGSFGCVYKCTDIGSKMEFALKKFRVSQQGCESYGALTCEIDILCAIGDHPKITKLIKKIESDKALYILMEYAPGGSLGEFCRKQGALAENKIHLNCAQILEALNYLHGKKVLHRDIKGDNILIFQKESLKLCDFGLSKVLTDIASVDLLNGVVQSNVGTANWMAPEVIHGEKYGIAADIWSFGATVVEMLTGKPPYHGFNTYQIIFKIGNCRKIEFQEPENLSSQLKSFINSCLQPNPCDRPTTSDLLNHEFMNLQI